MMRKSWGDKKITMTKMKKVQGEDGFKDYLKTKGIKHEDRELKSQKERETHKREWIFN